MAGCHLSAVLFLHFAVRISCLSSSHLLSWLLWSKSPDVFSAVLHQFEIITEVSVETFLGFWFWFSSWFFMHALLMDRKSFSVFCQYFQQVSWWVFFPVFFFWKFSVVLSGCFVFWFHRLWEPVLTAPVDMSVGMGYLVLVTILIDIPMEYMHDCTMYIDKSNDSYRGICTVDVFIVVLLVVLHVGVKKHNHPKYRFDKYWRTISQSVVHPSSEC